MNKCHSAIKCMSQRKKVFSKRTRRVEVHWARNKFHFKMADELRCLIQHYFHQGYEYQVILDFLSLQHGITTSLSTLKWRLHDYQLNTRQRVVDEEELRGIVQQEISGPGVLLGYRAVWHSLRLIHHIVVPRRKVASILRELNPDAVLQRRSRRLTRRKYTTYGPNFCWHVDGNFPTFLFWVIDRSFLLGRGPEMMGLVRFRLLS